MNLIGEVVGLSCSLFDWAQRTEGEVGQVSRTVVWWAEVVLTFLSLALVC
jgi:hypothetical protein